MTRLQKIALLPFMIATVMATGCATYRTDSNIDDKTAPSAAHIDKVIIAEDSLPGRKYTTVGPVEVSVKKLTVFNKDPTKEQANEALMEKARAIGADAVINVTYETGIGLTTWGYIDAKGTGVKLAE